MIIEAATPAFNDSALPGIGILMRISDIFCISSLTPLDSLPITRIIPPYSPLHRWECCLLGRWNIFSSHYPLRPLIHPGHWQYNIREF